MPSELRDVVGVLAQRWDRQLDDVDAVEQVLAEGPVGDQLREILVGGAEDAHVDTLFAFAADRAHRLLLDRAQQLDLQQQRQLADLVEQQRATVCGLEQAILVARRAGEAALAVAEQLALHQFGRDGAAVDGDERSFGAWPEVVDHARRQFLAGARLATDVDRCLAACELGDQCPGVVHLRRIADQRQARAASGPAFGKAQRRAGQVAQGLQVDRLGDEVEGARFERIDGGFHVAVGGDHRGRQIGMVGLDVAHQVDAVAVGQAHVGQAEVEPVATEQGPRPGEVVGGAAVHLHALQRQPEQLADVRFVVDDQREGAGHGVVSGGVGSAKRMRKQLPPRAGRR